MYIYEYMTFPFDIYIYIYVCIKWASLLAESSHEEMHSTKFTQDSKAPDFKLLLNVDMLVFFTGYGSEHAFHRFIVLAENKYKF
jgi:hypothetical protein